MAVERRKYPRSKPPPEYTFTCVSSDFEQPLTPNANLALKFVDVSAKGALIVTRGRLREGVGLKFEIANPGHHAVFRGKGIVRWSQTWTRNGREAHVAGVEFMEALEIRGQEMEAFTPWVRGRSAVAGEGRRQHARFVPTGCSAECYKVGLLGASSTNAARKLMDMSQGGVQMDCVEKMDEGQKVSLRLEFKDPRALILAQGEVCWCKRNTLLLEPHWMTGIRFTKVSPEDQALIGQFSRVFALQGGGRFTEEGPPADLV